MTDCTGLGFSVDLATSSPSECSSHCPAVLHESISSKESGNSAVLSPIRDEAHYERVGRRNDLTLLDITNQLVLVAPQHHPVLTASAEIVSAHKDALVTELPSLSNFSPSLTIKLAEGTCVRSPGSNTLFIGNLRRSIHPIKLVATPPVKKTTAPAVMAPAHASLELFLSTTSRRSGVYGMELEAV